MSGIGHFSENDVRGSKNSQEVKLRSYSKGQKRKRLFNKENETNLQESLAKVARCFKRRKANTMGSGCTKNTATNVVKPIERDSTFSIETDRKVKKLSTPIRGSTSLGNDEFTAHVDKVSDEKEPAKNNNDLTKELHDGKTKAMHDGRTEELPGWRPKEMHDGKPKELHDGGTEGMHDGKDSIKENIPGESNVPKKRGSLHEDSLKHYTAQTNLLKYKPIRRQQSVDDVFEISSHVNSSKDKTEQRIPPLPRRYKRQPTIHNSVCFQEDDQINHYHIQEEIGRGSFATVYKCLSSKTNETYAMKVISKKRLIRKNGLMARHPRKGRSNPLDGLHREIAILKNVDHPNIVKLVEVIDDPEIDNVYMVFEMMRKGPALEIPTDTPMSEEKARQYFRDTILGLEYLHHTKIIHRDIKPSNLLLGNDDHVKIADFGVSDMFEGDDDMLNRFAGSPAFQAPEATAEGRSKFSGKAADIWALGVTLFSFIYGKCPFYDKDIVNLYEKIRNEQLVFPEEPLVDPQLQDLISRLLSKDARQRIKMFDIKNHPWVTQGGREMLPATNEHCIAIEVTDEDVKNSVTLISKLSSLVLVKTILKRRTFSSSKKTKKSSIRSNSTPDIGQTDESYKDFINRTKSATILISGNTKPL